MMHALKLLGLLLALAAVLALLWLFAPQYLPHALRQNLPEPSELPVSELIPEQLRREPAREPSLYRWKDEQGQWVVSDRPPEGSQDYEELRYHPDTNVLPAHRQD